MTAEEASADMNQSSMGALTDEQQRFLEECELQFGSRYTDADPEYVRERDAGLCPPPIVDPWYNKPRRNFDWSKQQGGGAGAGGRRQHQSGWAGRNERHGEGGGYQHHRQTDRYQQRHRPY